MIRRTRTGFTLIEILIVVVILGILAAVVIPQFADAADSAGVASARTQLQTMRSQIELHRAQVGSYPTADWEDDLAANDYIRSATVNWPTDFTAVYIAPDPNDPTIVGGDLSLTYAGSYDVDGPEGNETPAAAVLAW